MVFSRTGLTFNNNDCGFAGCAGHPGFVGFSGNYMYGVGSGYFEIAATGGNVFHGLEFTIGTGFDINPQNVSWQAFSSSILVGSGTLSLESGTIIGFSDAIGFDNLRYTSDDRDRYGYVAPAFDSVHAQFTAADSRTRDLRHDARRSWVVGVCDETEEAASCCSADGLKENHDVLSIRTPLDI